MYKEINDYELIYLIRNNDEESFNTLFDKYSPIVFKIANKYYDCYKRGDIDDYIQEGFVGLNYALNTYDEKRNVLFYTYACLCIKSHVLAYYKKMTSKRNNFYHDVFSYDYYEDMPLTNLIADKSLYNQESYMLDFDNAKKLIDFKNNLDINHSAVFELRYNGFKHKEIAVLLDISMNTVQTYINYCKVKLKNIMNDC